MMRVKAQLTRVLNEPETTSRANSIGGSSGTEKTRHDFTAATWPAVDGGLIRAVHPCAAACPVRRRHTLASGRDPPLGLVPEAAVVVFDQVWPIE